MLAQHGLGAALIWLAENTHARFGLVTRASVADDLPALPAETAVLLFQYARELVYNVIKHVGTNSGRIELAPEAGRLRLVVEDDGVGLTATRGASAGATGGGVGLYRIRERLALLAGSLGLVNDPAGGTRAIMRVPLSPAAGPVLHVNEPRPPGPSPAQNP